MNFSHTLEQACGAGARAAEKARQLAAQDRRREENRLKNYLEERNKPETKRGFFSRLIGSATHVSEGMDDEKEKALKINVLRHHKDEEWANRIKIGFQEIWKTRENHDFPANLPVSFSKAGESIRISCDFIRSNDLQHQERRRKALKELEGNMKSLLESVEKATVWQPSVEPMEAGETRKWKGVKGAVGTSQGQMFMDFSGNGRHDVVRRIWLPVPQSRRNELIGLGAKWDPEGPKRGSRLWVPVEDAAKFDSVLPLAFRSKPTRFEYPPIRHGAVGQNLGKVFDKESWNRLRFDAYDRAGHRCQICGKQGGKFWEKIATDSERRTSGPVDCHEIWEWSIPIPGIPVGIQKLKRLLVVCKDCHLCFHEGYALSKASKVGLEEEARERIEKLRMLTNRMNRKSVKELVEKSRREWEENKSITRWILDLSMVSAQEIMHDHILVLDPRNAAGVTPDMVGGIRFRYMGETYAAIDAEALARGAVAQVERS